MIAKMALFASIAASLLFAATSAHASPVIMSNTEVGRGEFGYTQVIGEAMVGAGTRVPYLGNFTGVRYTGAQFMRRWVGYQVDFRLQLGGVSTPRVDLGLGAAFLFAPARWQGRYPGSFVLGAGMGAGLGRPMWVDIGQELNAFALARFILLPRYNVKVQAEYRLSPISTHLPSFGLWVWAHDFDIAAGKNTFHGGLRGRVERITAIFPGQGTYTSVWFGPFLGLVIK